MTWWTTGSTAAIVAGVLLSLLGLGAVLAAPRRLSWAQQATVYGYGLAVAGVTVRAVLAWGVRALAVLAAVLALGLLAGAFSRLR